MYRANRSIAVLTLGFVVFAACDDRNTPAEPNLADQPADAQASISESPALVRPHEAEFHRLSKEIEGYGGHYFDEQGNLVVHLTDAAQTDRARQLLEPVLQARPLSEREVGLASQGSVVVRRADFTFPQLAAWRDRATDAVLASEGVEFTDLDEVQNRLVIGVTSLKGRMAAAQVLQRLRVPTEAVVLEETQPAVRFQSLQHRFRPLRGGFQIQRVNGGYCTLGFNAIRGGVGVFLTNSHCTSNYMAPDGSFFHQATVAAGNLVGQEIHDPNTFHRWSDAAVIRRSSGVAADYGYIARTTFYATGKGNSGSLTVNANNPRMRITGEQAYPTVGQTLDKIGRTTGWTYGTVARTCVDHSMGGGRTLRCQDWVNPMNAWYGDSGSPVFRWHGSTVTLAGILWGGQIQNGQTQYTFFSAMANIKADLGAFSTF
jgi:hypothetical protein